jgi:hypothetical protein
MMFLRGGKLGWQFRQVSCIDTSRRWLPPIGILKSALRPKSQDLPAGECRHNGYLFRGAYSRLCALIATNRQ